LCLSTNPHSPNPVSLTRYPASKTENFSADYQKEHLKCQEQQIQWRRGPAVKKILKMAKGYYGARKNVWTVAKNAVEKGLLYAYSGRKQRKRQFRSLWIQRINAGARQHGMSYSEFMGKCSKKGIELNRKVLADLAMNHPDAFKAVVDQVK
jgi:large subunit ribosomal protein L20